VKPDKNSERISDHDLKGALTAVKYGYDPVAALNLIEYFHKKISEDGAYHTPFLLEYIHHAFGKIVEEGWSADHAFGLKLKRGNYPRTDHTERNVQVAAYVILLRRRKWTLLDAKGEAANLFFPDGKGEKAVESAYAFYRESLEILPDETLTTILPHGTPVISRDMTG
jgi:hypothetical protein